MKKTLWALLAALVLLAAVLGAKECSDRARHARRFVFDTLNVAQVTHLDVEYQGEAARLVRKDGGWFVESDGFPVDSARIAGVLNTLLRMQSTEQVSESKDPARLVEFGLGPDEAKRVRWTLASGETQEVLLGKTSGADLNSTYWKWEGDHAVYRTPGNFNHRVSVHDNDWKARNVLPFFLYEDVASVRVDWIDSTGATQHYRIDRTSDTSARMVEPEERPIRRDIAGEIFVQTPQFTVDALVEPWEDRAVMGLDTPQVRVEIVMKDGATHRVQGGHLVKENNQTYRYAILPGTSHAIKIFEWRFAFFRKTVDYLRNPPPRKPDTPADAYQVINPADFPEGTPHRDDYSEDSHHH